MPGPASEEATSPSLLPGLNVSASPDGEGEITIDGVVQRVVFTAPDGEFAVIRLEVEGDPPLIAVIGPLGSVVEGQPLRISGRWDNHPQYGRRLKATAALPRPPQTEAGVERYLATLAGLGPESARKLVAGFGLKALDTLRLEPWRVAQIKGIGKRRAQRASADARARHEEEEIMVSLQGYGITPAESVRIRRTYGEAALVKVRENPYRMARDVTGIGFQKADRIAQSMGIDRMSPLRLEAGLIYALETAKDAGHCYLPAQQLCATAFTELRLAEEPKAEEGALAEALKAPVPDPALGQTLVRDAMDSLGLRNELVLEGEDVYLPRLHRAEVALARRVAELRGADRAPVPRVHEGGDRAGLALAEGQRRALRLIEESPVCVITGGPGTGKTTIVRTLVQTWEHASRRVLLVAPTGRAAKRLSEATGRPASTVHRLLEWTPKEGFRRRSDRTLEVDLLVCDEASMLDLPLARSLFQAVPPGATLLLVGDVDQLPSVGPGQVLGDLIGSQQVPVARLTEIFRQAEGSGIVDNAHRILHGSYPVSAQRGESSGDFYLIEADDPVQARDLVVRTVSRRIPQRFGLDPVRDVQVLTPMHRGESGTEELNRALQEVLNPPREPATPLLHPGKPPPPGELRGRGRSFRLGDKVMQIRNDYDRDVWNGDVGIVGEIDPDEGELVVRFDDDREVVYEVEDLDQLQLAYAVSVHKSQGSEYPAVVITLLMQHYMLLRRNLLYTAVTRGKRLVVIVGSQRALKRAIAEQGDLLRYTRLCDRLRSLP